MNFKLTKLIILLLVFSFFLPCFAKDITITVVYNNVPYNKDLTCVWGFSCFIEGLEKNILFDTGGDGKILLFNMKKLDINPDEIDAVVLSHIHGDHVGGLWSILEENNKILVYLPQLFPTSFKDRASRIAREIISVTKPIQICEGVWSTGQLGTWIKEQSLVINLDEGLIVITGCAHPGIVNIVKRAMDMFQNQVYLVFGGFHLISYTESQVREVISQLKELGVRKVGPSHCTGGRPIELFKEAWGKDFINLGCGAEIKIP